jgi:peptide/nickel transport system permease protein
MTRRLLTTAGLLLGITFLCFGVIHLAPGTAVDARSQFNTKMTAQAKERLAELYGLNKPFLSRYASWASRAARLDFGKSFADGEDAAAKIGRAVPVTRLLNLLTLAVVFGVGVPLGIWSAVRRGTAAERFVGHVTMIGFSLPTFWLALVLMSWLGVEWRVLPVSGLHSIRHDVMGPLERFFDTASHLVLPVTAAAVTGIAGISRYMRASMSAALSGDFVRTARAKGLDERRVVWGHALPNALLPVITILGLSVPSLLGGSVLFESIFSIPGMGRLFFMSVVARDYPVVMGILFIGAILTLLGNLLADLAYAWADPRIRLE